MKWSNLKCTHLYTLVHSLYEWSANRRPATWVMHVILTIALVDKF